MNVSKVCGLASILALASLAPLNSQGAVAYDFTPGGGNLPGNQTGDWALGNTFTPNQPIMLTGLRVFDLAGDGIGGSGVEVSVHRITPFGPNIFDGTPVAGASFLFSGTAQSYDGTTGTRFVSITPTLLTVGATYMVVANRMGSEGAASEQNYNVPATGGTPAIPVDNGGGLVTFGPSYYKDDATWSRSVSWVDLGDPQPWTQDLSGFSPAFAAGNFDFTPVPEAQHFALAGAALMGLVYVGRLTLRRKATA